MDSQALQEEALGFHQRGNLAEAETRYRQILATQPGSYQTHYLFAVLKFQQGHADESLGLLASALKLNPLAPEALVLNGVVLQSRGRIPEALQNFDKALAQTPNRAEIWNNRGIALRDLRRLEDASASFEKALALNPSYPEALNNNAGILHELGRSADSLLCLDTLLALQPDNADVLGNRAQILEAMGRLHDALASYDRALRVRPGVAAWNGRASLLSKLERYPEALESVQKALALQPDNPQALHNQGIILHKLERPQEALASYDRALRADSNAAESWNSRGSVLQELRRRDDALASYDRAIALNPDYAEAWNNRGLVLRDLLRLDESLAAYDRALALNPHYARVWNSRCSTLMKMGRAAEALASVQKSLEMQPAAQEAMHNLGCALCENHRIAEGFEAFTRLAKLKVMKNTPQNESAAKARAKHDAEQEAYIAQKGQGSGAQIAGRAINDTNVTDIERQWRSNKPQIVAIDNFLNPEALEKLRHFLLAARIWDKTYKGGYVGAFPESGFATPLLAQIAEELRLTYPAIFGDHALRYAWAFKYDSDLSGIKIHADQAAVNVNFWITPDESNLNPDNGGLVIWDAAAPLDWEISRYNGNDDSCRDFLAQAKSKPTSVPYRANRAVIFDSDLFHETDRFEFAEGYENRRINVTLLYGERSAYEP